MCLSGIIGQILFRIYFNAFDIQVIWYLGFVFLFQPFLKYFLIFSIISAFFLAFGSFWALPIYDKIDNNLPFPINYISNAFNKIIFEPYLDKKYQFGYKYSPPITIKRETFDDFYYSIINNSNYEKDTDENNNILNNNSNYDDNNVFNQALGKSQEFSNSLESTSLGMKNTKTNIDKVSNNSNELSDSLSSIDDNVDSIDDSINNLSEVSTELSDTTNNLSSTGSILRSIHNDFDTDIQDFGMLGTSVGGVVSNIVSDAKGVIDTTGVGLGSVLGGVAGFALGGPLGAGLGAAAGANIAGLTELLIDNIF